jgi:hypothetical protein
MEDNYGWSVTYPMATLTTTSQRLPNQPTSEAHTKNLGLLSDFLAKLPFFVKVNSGYRSPAVNDAVGGTATSQHPNGLAADIQVSAIKGQPWAAGVTNKDLATYFWYYRDKLPELDQVIWYTTKSHTHIGICPPGATGCPPKAPRGEFLISGVKEPWSPSSADMSTTGAKLLIAMGPPGGFPVAKALAIGGATLLSLTGLGLMYYYVWRPRS